MQSEEEILVFRLNEYKNNVFKVRENNSYTFELKNNTEDNIEIQLHFSGSKFKTEDAENTGKMLPILSKETKTINFTAEETGEILLLRSD